MARSTARAAAAKREQILASILRFGRQPCEDPSLGAIVGASCLQAIRNECGTDPGEAASDAA